MVSRHEGDDQPKREAYHVVSIEIACRHGALCAALSSVATLASAEDAKEKCFGVALAGQNHRMGEWTNRAGPGVDCNPRKHERPGRLHHGNRHMDGKARMGSMEKLERDLPKA